MGHFGNSSNSKFSSFSKTQFRKTRGPLKFHNAFPQKLLEKHLGNIRNERALSLRRKCKFPFRFDHFCVDVVRCLKKVFKFLTFGLGMGATTLSTPRIEVVDLANECQSHNSVSKSSENHRTRNQTNQTNQT